MNNAISNGERTAAQPHAMTPVNFNTINTIVNASKNPILLLFLRNYGFFIN